MIKTKYLVQMHTGINFIRNQFLEGHCIGLYNTEENARNAIKRYVEKMKYTDSFYKDLTYDWFNIIPFEIEIDDNDICYVIGKNNLKEIK